MSETLSIEVRSESGPPVLVVTGELDIATAPSLTVRVYECLASGHSSIEVDLSQITFLGSAGISALLECRKRALQSGATFRVVRPSRAVLRVLTGHLGQVLVGPRALEQTKLLQCLVCDTTTPHIPGPSTVGSDGAVLVRWWSCTKCDEGHSLP